MKNTKPKQTRKFKNCSHVPAYHCAQLWYTTQHRTGLIIFPPNLQTINMLFLGGDKEYPCVTMSITYHE